MRKYEFAYEPGLPTYWAFYIHGQAFLRLKDGNKAAAAFQTILDHRGLGTLGDLYPLAQLQLGRARAFEDDSAKARVPGFLRHLEKCRARRPRPRDR
jgi:hypothetical protein